MIKVLIVKETDTGDTELGRIEIRNEGSEAGGDNYDYSIRFAVERGTAVGFHKRWIYSFPRKSYNVLALLSQALNTLDEKELQLERGFDPDGQEEATGSPDLARRLYLGVRKVQRRKS